MARQWRDPAQRELWQLTIDAIRDVDRVFAGVADEVYVIVAGFPVINATTRPIIMRRIDAVLNRAFGSTQRAAVTSDLFRVILRNTDRAAAAPYVRMFQRMERVATQSSPSLWGRVRLRLLSGGRGPNDRIATVYAALNGPVAQQQRVLRTGLLDPQRRWVPKERWNTATGYRLSDRGWKQGRLIRSNIDDILRQGVREGDDPLLVARKLERYLNPEAAPLIYRQDGRIIMRDITKAPRSGHGSTWARRLARTEMSRIHGAATIQAVKDVPFTAGIQWMLSNRHTHPDACTDNARRDAHGMGPGIYPVDKVPRFPNHPNDLCVLSPWLPPRDVILDELVKTYGGLV